MTELSNEEIKNLVEKYAIKKELDPKDSDVLSKMLFKRTVENCKVIVKLTKNGKDILKSNSLLP